MKERKDGSLHPTMKTNPTNGSNLEDSPPDPIWHENILLGNGSKHEIRRS